MKAHDWKSDYTLAGLRKKKVREVCCDLPLFVCLLDVVLWELQVRGILNI